MNEPAIVCGATTNKRTACQNTLLTGCGLCPVHASQLRASRKDFKPMARRRPAIRKLKKRERRSVTDAVTNADGLNEQNDHRVQVGEEGHCISEEGNVAEHKEAVDGTWQMREMERFLLVEQAQIVEGLEEALKDCGGAISPVSPGSPTAYDPLEGEPLESDPLESDPLEGDPLDDDLCDALYHSPVSTDDDTFFGIALQTRLFE